MHDLTLVLGKPVYDQIPVSEVRLVNVVEKEANVDDEEEEESIPLALAMKKVTYLFYICSYQGPGWNEQG